jgi:RND family efflux transporter MFP subunit
MRTGNTGRLWVAGAALAVSACGKGEAAVSRGPVEVVVGPEAIEVVQTREMAVGPTLSGTLAAEREAQVTAQVAGNVVQVLADRGQTVARGQLLARIDDAAISDGVTSAQSGVRSAQIAVSTAQRNSERVRTLAQAGALADRDLEVARTQLATGQAQLADARARLAQAQKQQQNTGIRAPLSGVVSARPVNSGDVVQPGMPLFTIIDPGSLRLEGSVPATELGSLRVGAPVRFAIGAYRGRYPHRHHPAHLPGGRPGHGGRSRGWTIPNQDGVLVSDSFAEGRVQAEARQAVTAPADAVDERRRGAQRAAAARRQGGARDGAARRARL